jgi:hypothetical protein
MASTALPTEGLYEASVRQGQVKHAVKTAVACSLATGVSYVFHVPDGQFAPLFAFLIMVLGMPSPRLNWLLTQLAIVVSATASALILITLRDALFLYLAVTLLWIFVCLLFSNWFPLPATLGAMVSALGIFVFRQGTVGDTLLFYVAYGLNWFIGGLAVVVVHTLLWHWNTRKVFLESLAATYAVLEGHCRSAAERIRSGESAAVDFSPEQWAPFRPLRQLLAPELRRGRDTANPFARIILACRSLNLRLWFFNRAIAPLLPAALPPETRLQMASLLDRCADQLHALLESVIHRKQVPPMSDEWRGTRDEPIPDSSLITRHSSLVTRQPFLILPRLAEGLRTLTTCHNALLANLRAGLAGELVTLSPVTTGKRLLDGQSLRASTKLVIILLLLLVEEVWLGFPGGSQVAFYATFFASTGNLGRQNKTDLVGLAGLLAGFAYGVLAAFLTSRMPHFPLLLALVFLGEFVANLAFQRLPRYGVAGLQAGLAIPFAYLATTGPEWGSFAAVRTRFAGLVVAGFTAVVVHAYLWPVLPMHLLRASIAAALRATAASLVQLFGPSRSTWAGSPPSLEETVTRARDLLDDARYLPGPEHADSAYYDILGHLQEVDANLEYVHFLIGLEQEHPLRQRFFETIGDYAEQARTNLEQVARQFQPSPRRAARVEPVHWEPDVFGRWEQASADVGPVPQEDIDPWRPAVIARCLDQIARAVEKISAIAWKINLRNRGR